MNDTTPAPQPPGIWDELVAQVRGQTLLVLGPAGSGKTTLARYLAQRLSSARHPVGLVSADPGQPAVGVPTCLGLSLARPYREAVALWFVGDTTPAGSLLPTVVGTARLAALARAEGAKTVLIDTSGLVSGSLGRLLKYHKAVATGADQILAVEQADELQGILELLRPVIPDVRRLAPAALARNRTAAQRRGFRQAAYRRHFERARVVRLDPRLLVDRRWLPLREPLDRSLVGRVVGLNDGRGICRGLAILEAIGDDHLQVFTACPDLSAVTWLQMGRLFLDRQADFAESRGPRPDE